MDTSRTCGTHQLNLVEVGNGVFVCPLCEADDADSIQVAGNGPDTVGPGYVAVPAEGTRLVSIRLAKRDLERAKVLAKARKMPYQRYLKRLLTIALDQEEHDVFSRKVGGQ